MLSMSVTLDMSKFSDWLNADAPCQESRGENAVRGRLVWSGMPACTGRLDWSLSKGRTGGVFTLNICPIFLTLDVSKFSGWLKLSASCQVERRAHKRCGAGC